MKMNFESQIIEFVKENPNCSSNEILQGVIDKKKSCNNQKSNFKTYTKKPTNIIRKRKIYTVSTFVFLYFISRSKYRTVL